MTLSPAQAVLFDLDGVLLDTEPIYSRGIQEVLAEFGHIYDWSIKRDMMGRSDVESAQLLVGRLNLPLSVEEYMARREPVLERLLAESPAMPGAPELVRELCRLRCPVAIATSSRTPLYNLKARSHDFLREIAVVVCGDDPEVKALKPAPDIFLVAAARLGVNPEDCIVVEDSPAGVAAARAAGMQVIALPDPELGESAVANANLIARTYASLRQALLGALCLATVR